MVNLKKKKKCIFCRSLIIYNEDLNNKILKILKNKDFTVFETIKLVNDNLNSKDVRILFNIINDSKTLLHLNLSYNILIDHIEWDFIELPNIEKIIFFQYTPKNVHIIIPKLQRRFKFLTHFMLYHKHIVDNDNFLVCHGNIIQIEDLIFKKISKSNIELILNAETVRIKSMDIDLLDQVCDKIKKNIYLKRIYLSKLKLDDKNICKILDAISELPILEYIDMSNNKITDEIWKHPFFTRHKIGGRINKIDITYHNDGYIVAPGRDNSFDEKNDFIEVNFEGNHLSRKAFYDREENDTLPGAKKYVTETQLLNSIDTQKQDDVIVKESLNLMKNYIIEAISYEKPLKSIQDSLLYGEIGIDEFVFQTLDTLGI
jgi:hypothetical protein